MLLAEFLFFIMVFLCIMMLITFIAVAMEVNPKLGRALFGLFLIAGFVAGAAIPAVPYF